MARTKTVSQTTAKKSTSKKPTRSLKADSAKTMRDMPSQNSFTDMSPSQPSSPSSSRASNAGGKMRWIVLALIALAALAYYFRGYFVVALVNGQPITRFEIIKELENQGGKSVLDSIVSEKLIRQEVSKKNIEVSEKDVQDRMKLIEEQLKSSGQSLDKVLEEQGMTRAQVEEQTRLQISLKKLLGDKIKVTDVEVDEAAEQQKALKPETLSDEEFMAQVRESLENEKLSFEAQTYIQGLQKAAKIKYLYTY